MVAARGTSDLTVFVQRCSLPSEQIHCAVVRFCTVLFSAVWADSLCCSLFLYSAVLCCSLFSYSAVLCLLSIHCAVVCFGTALFSAFWSDSSSDIVTRGGVGGGDVKGMAKLWQLFMLHVPAVNAVLGQIVRCDKGITLSDWISASYHELDIQVEFPWPPAGLKAGTNCLFVWVVWQVFCALFLVEFIAGFSWVYSLITVLVSLRTDCVLFVFSEMHRHPDRERISRASGWPERHLQLPGLMYHPPWPPPPNRHHHPPYHHHHHHLTSTSSSLLWTATACSSFSLCATPSQYRWLNTWVLGCTGTAWPCRFFKRMCGRSGLDALPNTFLARTSLCFHVYTTVTGSLSVGIIGCGVCYLRLCVCVLVLLGVLSACVWVSVRMPMSVCSVCVSCAVMLVNCV